MKKLRRETKTEKLFELFKEEGTSIPLEEVLERTGIPSKNGLTTYFVYFRKSPYVRDESRLNIKVVDGNCISFPMKEYYIKEGYRKELKV